MGALADQVVAAVTDVHRAGFNRHLGGEGSRFDYLVERVLDPAHRIDLDVRDGNIGPDDGRPRGSVEVVWVAAPAVRFTLWGLATDLLAPGVLANFRPSEHGLTKLPCGSTASWRVLLPAWCDDCGQPLSVAPGHSAEGVAVVPVACGATVVLITLCSTCEDTKLQPGRDLVLRVALT